WRLYPDEPRRQLARRGLQDRSRWAAGDFLLRAPVPGGGLGDRRLASPASCGTAGQLQRGEDHAGAARRELAVVLERAAARLQPGAGVPARRRTDRTR